jgi:hypothetical protein
VQQANVSMLFKRTTVDILCDAFSQTARHTFQLTCPKTKLAYAGSQKKQQQHPPLLHERKIFQRKASRVRWSGHRVCAGLAGKPWLGKR